MSLKTKRHKTQNQEVEQVSANTQVNSSIKNAVRNVFNTINHNKRLIGSIATAVSGAFFLFRTNSGRRVRNNIQNGAVNLFETTTGQLTSGWGQVHNLANGMMARFHTDDLTRYREIA